MNGNRSLDWYFQAKEEISYARMALDNKKFSLCCFLCQQSAEKFLKAIAIYRNLDVVRGHSIVRIAQALGVNGEILDAGRLLDQYYISTRYPDALPSGSPFEFFSERQASEALDFLLKFEEIASKELHVNQSPE
jgi:HEPN domain-containing protein